MKINIPDVVSKMLVRLVGWKDEKKGGICAIQETEDPNLPVFLFQADLMNSKLIHRTSKLSSMHNFGMMIQSLASKNTQTKDELVEKEISSVDEMFDKIKFDFCKKLDSIKIKYCEGFFLKNKAVLEFVENFDSGVFEDDKILISSIEKMVRQITDPSLNSSYSEKKLQKVFDHYETFKTNFESELTSILHEKEDEIYWGIDEKTKSLFKQWLEPTYEKFEIQLLFDSSTNGKTAEKFHSKCDLKGPTLTLCVNERGCKFGGFNPQSWDSCCSSLMHEATFCFSLDHEVKFEKNGSKRSVQNHKNFGPIFGQDFFYIPNNLDQEVVMGGKINGFNFKGLNHLDIFGTASPFKIINYQVFSVIELKQNKNRAAPAKVSILQILIKNLQ